MVGANFTDTVIDPPVAIVLGIVSPLTLYPVACTDSAEIVAGADPLFVIFTEIVWLVPTSTDPKLPDDGLNDSVPLSSSPCACVVLAETTAASMIHTAYRRVRRRARRVGC